jgi:hypothetical protein
MKQLLILFVISSAYAGIAQEMPEAAQEMLDRAQLTLVVPEHLQSSEPIGNRQMNWEFAYKHPEKKFEVRYAIRPLDTQVAAYEEFQRNKKEGEIMIDPNNWYSSVFDATILNISGGQLPEATEFGTNAVKREFNADWGATVLTETGDEFGQGYRYALVVSLHKDNVADVYVFYMGDDKEVIIEQMDLIFHALKFR